MVRQKSIPISCCLITEQPLKAVIWNFTRLSPVYIKRHWYFLTVAKLQNSCNFVTTSCFCTFRNLVVSVSITTG